MNIDFDNIVEDLRPYHSSEAGAEILEELYHNAFRTIKHVYIFQNFDKYEIQLRDSKNEDKNEIYWNALYYEKLIDYIKISVAFETYNKALLIEYGILVHKIRKSRETKVLHKKQNDGFPITIKEFKEVCKFKREGNFGDYYLDGLQIGYPTISYRDTLNEHYQKIINLDDDLLFRLKEISEKRNRLHFFTDFKGGFVAESHLNKWRQIMKSSTETIERKIRVKN